MIDIKSPSKYRIIDGIIPIDEGGTSNDTVIEDITLFDAVPSSEIAIPNGLIDIVNNFIPKEYIPDVYGSKEVNIVGPVSVGTESFTSYFINDYDSFKTYTISCLNGSVSRIKDTLTYIASSQTGNDTLTINGQNFIINVFQSYVVKPIILSPISGSIDLNKSITVTSNNFQTIGKIDQHYSTDWQVSKNSNFSNIIFELLNSSTNLLSTIVNNLEPNTTYFIRTRYKGVSLPYSNWSDIVAITTRVMFLPTNQEAILNPNLDYLDNDFKAIAISGDGSTLVVGKHNDYSSISGETGIVYIYNRNNSTWTLNTSLEIHNPNGQSAFGYSLDISNDGSTIAIGAPHKNNFTGSVEIYSKVNNVWLYQALLESIDVSYYDNFGLGLCLSSDGNRVAVVCKGGSAVNNSIIYIYTRSGTTWSLETQLIPSIDEVLVLDYCKNIAFSQDSDRLVFGGYTALVGTKYNAGKVYIYNRIDTTWSLEAVIPYNGYRSNYSSRDFFGWTVAISNLGDYIYIGCVNASIDLNNYNAGKVFIYNRTGVSWSLDTTLLSNYSRDNLFFSYSLDVSGDGNLLAIGSQDQKTRFSTEPYGFIELFSKTNNIWSNVGVIQPTGLNYNSDFGNNLVISNLGNVLVSFSHVYNPSYGILDKFYVYS